MRVPIHPTTTIPGQADGSNHSRLALSKARAVGHALSLIGHYRGTAKPELIGLITALDSASITWVLSADAEELRSVLLPSLSGSDIIADWCK